MSVSKVVAAAGTAMALTLALATPATAQVLYEFNTNTNAGFQGTAFSFLLNDYITAPTIITTFQTCSSAFILGGAGASGATCDSVNVQPGANPFLLIFVNGPLGGTDFGSSFAGANLSTNGTYFGTTYANSSATTLTVSGSSLTGAVPEPGTWAMMLLGFGAIGCAMRRRASGAPQIA